MRTWLSTRLIRLARRIDKGDHDVVIRKPLAQNVTVYNVTGDPLAAARRVEQRARAYQTGFRR